MPSAWFPDDFTIPQSLRDSTGEYKSKPNFKNLEGYTSNVMFMFKDTKQKGVLPVQADLAKKAMPTIINMTPIQRVRGTVSWKMKTAANVPKM